MDIAALSSTGTKLLEALEKLGTSDGAGLRSPGGPGGMPPKELVQQFEALMNQPDEKTAQSIARQGKENIGSTEPVPGGTTDAVSGDVPLQHLRESSDTLRVTRANAMEESSPTNRSVLFDKAPGVDSAAPTTSDASATKDTVRELGTLLEKVSSGQLNPTELYRLQYLAGMLRVHGSAGQQVSQQTSQGFESLLKQQS